MQQEALSLLPKLLPVCYLCNLSSRHTHSHDFVAADHNDDHGATPLLLQPPVKRPRGRPRKDVSASISKAKKKLGRPRKEVLITGTTELPVKRKRGRPRKSPVDALVPEADTRRWRPGQVRPLVNTVCILF